MGNLVCGWTQLCVPVARLLELFLFPLETRDQALEVLVLPQQMSAEVCRRNLGLWDVTGPRQQCQL